MTDNRGLYRKYHIYRADGQSEPGRKHDSCRYFVIDLDHDEFMVPALEAYANACQEKRPNLAADIRAYIKNPGDDIITTCQHCQGSGKSYFKTCKTCNCLPAGCLCDPEKEQRLEPYDCMQCGGSGKIRYHRCTYPF